MSLFGTGRKEGIFAALMIGALTACTYLGAAWQHGAPDHVVQLTAFACALGGMACYRLLRCFGRSRYASFLGGLAYGLSPWFAGLSCAPRELLATALAPFALEIAGQCARASSRRRWLWLVGPCVALPFLFGLTMVACMSAALATLLLLHTAFAADNAEERAPVLRVLTALVIAAAAAANLVVLDPLAPVLGPAIAPTPWQVLSGDAAYPSVWNATTMLRIVSPFLLWFAALGILRRQRHASTPKWLLLAALGAAPMVAWGFAPELARHAPGLPATGWFLTVLAIVVLGAAGLDDFLDLPLRRRTRQYLLFGVTLLAAPLLPVFDATPNCTRQYVLFVSLVVLALASLTWRRLGILRFKTVLTTLAIAAVAAPMLQHHLLPPTPTLASPLAETVPLEQQLLQHVGGRPFWHYAGLCVAAALSVLLLVTRQRRAKA